MESKPTLIHLTFKLVLIKQAKRLRSRKKDSVAVGIMAVCVRHFLKLSQQLRGSVKKNSIFVDIAHIGGGEVNPMSTKNYNFNF